MIDAVLSHLDLYLLGVGWVLAGIVTGIHAMGVWQNFQEEQFGLPIADLGHKWFFMSCVCPPAAMLTTQMFFGHIPFRKPLWWRRDG